MKYKPGDLLKDAEDSLASHIFGSFNPRFLIMQVTSSTYTYLPMLGGYKLCSLICHDDTSEFDDDRKFVKV